MRTVIMILIVWAIIFGLFATGVKTMATQPGSVTQITTMDKTVDQFQRRNPVQPAHNDEAVVKSDDDHRNNIRLER